MRDLRSSLHVEEEVGTLLGGRALLFGALPAQQKLTKKRAVKGPFLLKLHALCVIGGFM